jgi:hypothetical protein
MKDINYKQDMFLESEPMSFGESLKWRIFKIYFFFLKTSKLKNYLIKKEKRKNENIQTGNHTDVN